MLEDRVSHLRQEGLRVLIPDGGDAHHAKADESLDLPGPQRPVRNGPLHEANERGPESVSHCFSLLVWTHAGLYGRVALMRGLLIRTFGYGVSLAERIRDLGDGSDDTAADAVIGSGIRHCALSPVPGNPDRAFFLMENTDPPHPLQAAQLEEVSHDLRAVVSGDADSRLSDAARLLGVI